MAHGYQTRQDDDLLYWTTMHNVAWFFDHVVICNLVITKKRYISNLASPMDTKLCRVVAYDIWVKTQKITSLLVKSSFHW